MQSIQDAAKLNAQEGTTFYVSPFLFQARVAELTLANAAQFAHRLAHVIRRNPSKSD